MENKDNIFKLITRILLFGFLVFSLYIVVFPPKSESFWLLLPFVLGSLAWLVIGVVVGFAFIGGCVFLLTRFLNWAFNTDYFD